MRMSTRKLKPVSKMRPPRNCGLLGLLDRRLQPLDGERVLAAHVDVALVGADREGGDRHALEHPVRVALEDAAVHEGAGVALVGVADDELPRALGLVDRAPLEAGGVAAAAPAPQARGRDLLDHVERRHLGDGLLERLVGALGDARLDPLGVDAAGVLEDDLPLLGEEGVVPALEEVLRGRARRPRPRRRCGPRSRRSTFS